MIGSIVSNPPESGSLSRTGRRAGAARLGNDRIYPGLFRVLAIDPVPGEVRTDGGHQPPPRRARQRGSVHDREANVVRPDGGLPFDELVEGIEERACPSHAFADVQPQAVNPTTPVSVSPARIPKPQVVRVNSHSGAAVRTTMGSDGVSSWRALMTAICRIAWPKPCPEM